MAFTGSAVVTQISEKECVIRGLSLAGAAAGTISLFDGTVAGGVVLPEAFNPKQYTFNSVDVSLVDAIEVTEEPAVTAVTTRIPIRILAVGATPQTWLCTLTNDTAATASPGLCIRVRFN